MVYKVIQWVFAALFVLCSLSNGFHYSSLLLLMASVLMMPIPKIRNIPKNYKMKNWLAIFLSVIVFFAGACLSPTVNPETDTNQIIGDTTSTGTTAQYGSSSIPDNSVINPSQTNTSSNLTSSNSNADVTPLNVSTIPAYSGNPYVVINNNQPSFSADGINNHRL